MSEDQTHLRRTLEDSGVRYVMGCYVDIHGVPKAKVVPLPHLEHMLEGSELYTAMRSMAGSGAQRRRNFQRARPAFADYSALAKRRGVDGRRQPFSWRAVSLSTRVVLQKQIERARAMGYTFNLGIEGEIYVLGRTKTASCLCPTPTTT
jgi:glutamine synthetase